MVGFMQYLDLSENSNFHILKGVFKNTSKIKINEIIQKSVVRKYQKNDLILNKDNQNKSLFILLDGIIQIGYLSPSGRFHAFNYFSEKHVINLVSCFNASAIDYDYYAFNQVKILQIPHHLFIQEIKENIDLNQDCLSILSQRMQRLTQQVKFLQVANLAQKIAKILLDLSRQYGVRHPSGIEIQLKISQQDLADLISVSRQTINKEIKKLMQLEILDWQYESILIKKIEYFENEIHCI